jgi:mannose-6-phosphate isomerase
MHLYQPIQLLPRFVKRIWGREDLSPWFEERPDGAPVGEVWYSGLENETSLGRTLEALVRESGGAILGEGRCESLPLLVKLLFTSERLSIQVHPDDDEAQRGHGCPGKTECWHILEASDGAEVAWGFERRCQEHEVRAAAAVGTLEHLLHWRRVYPGDTVFTPAGTVHAIGAGLVLCEVQQNSDITYRLSDYGRGRALHLDEGLKVARLEPETASAGGERLAEGRDLLVRCSKFCLERLTAPEAGLGPSGFYHLWLQTQGSATLETPQTRVETVAGQAWLLPAGMTGLEVRLQGEALVAYPSRRESTAITVRS